MLSDRKRAANKANAQKSTGPRSSAGKMQARLNALKHGLSATRALDCDLPAEVAALNRLILAGRNHPNLSVRARALAEAQMQIERVRKAKLALLEASKIDSPTTESAVGLNVADLERLDRYEGRARTRRNRALRDWLQSLEAVTIAHSDAKYAEGQASVECLQNEPTTL